MHLVQAKMLVFGSVSVFPNQLDHMVLEKEIFIHLSPRYNDTSDFLRHIIFQVFHLGAP